MASKFIDCSEHNTIDWSKAKSEVQAAYIRCGLRGSLKETAPQDYMKIRADKKWVQNLKAVQEYKIPFGPYYFPTAITDEEAIEGAKWFYNQIKNLDLSYPPILDSENVWGKNKEAGRANKLSKEERTRLLKIVTDYFNAQGMNIGIYASASWLSSKINMAAFPDSVRKCTWVADSTGAVDYNGYYWLHQYGKGYCAGCSSDIDLNRVVNPVPAVYLKAQQKQTVDPIDVLMDIIDAEIGYHEKASNSGLDSKTANSGSNNYTKYGKEMHQLQPSNMDFPAAWCDTWVDWCIVQLCKRFGFGADIARNVLGGNFDDYTYNSVNIYKKAGRWTSKAGRGHQIFFGGAGHTGFVRYVDGNRVYTAEGNKSNEVRYCSYDINDSSIIGYGIPNYELLGHTLVDPVKEQGVEYGILCKGSTGNKVKFLQLCLGGLTVDGSFGWKTLNKVVAFQKAHDLEPDGEVGPKTWAAIVWTLPLIKRGNTGRYVEALQIALGGLTVDGSFGNKTYDAVIAYQTKYNLEVDGEVGPKTWSSIVAKIIMA